LFPNFPTERFFLEIVIGSTVLEMEFVPVVIIGRKCYAVLHTPHTTMEVFQEGIGLVLSRWSAL
jgi:hypothetical protein